jgi:hypothetical protein
MIILKCFGQVRVKDVQKVTEELARGSKIIFERKKENRNKFEL